MTFFFINIMKYAALDSTIEKKCGSLTINIFSSNACYELTTVASSCSSEGNFSWHYHVYVTDNTLMPLFRAAVSGSDGPQT